MTTRYQLSEFQEQFLKSLQMEVSASYWPIIYTRPKSTGEHITYFPMGNDFVLVLADYEIQEDFALTFKSDETFLRFGLVTSGVSRFQIEDQGHQVFYPSPYLTYEDRIQGEQAWERGHRYQAIEVFLAKSYLDGLSRRYPKEMMPLSGLQSNRVYLSLPKAVLDCLQYLEGAAQAKQLTPLLLEAKLLYCLFEILAAINRLEITDKQKTKVKAEKTLSRVPMGIRRSLLLTAEELDQVRAAKALVDTSLPSPPTVQELSATLKLSEQKLTYGFKALYHETIGTYIKNYRLLQAQALLVSSDLTLCEIAKRSGYSCTANLCNAFKLKFQISPIAYRNRLKK